MLYPQNGDRIVAIDSVTSLHPVYKRKYTAYRNAAKGRTSRGPG